MASLRFGSRKSRRSGGGTAAGALSSEAASRPGETDRAPTTYTEKGLSRSEIKRATQTRKFFALLTSFFLFISVIFLILVEVGNTHNRAVVRHIYFIRLDLSQIVAQTVPNAVLLNSIAQTLGLHDIYQVGLWNFCAGYNGQGITDCSRPKTLYWFNPVEILLNELLAGATIALPAEVLKVLDLIKTASHWMFGLFLAGVCLSMVMIFIMPLSVFSRWVALPVSLLTLLAALCTTLATILATVMFVILRNAVTSQVQLNIGASVGSQIFTFMWIASGFAILACLIQIALCCCCTSRRDVKKGKERSGDNGRRFRRPRYD